MLDSTFAFDSPLFKRLAHNDTGQALGHQAGVLIPAAMDSYFPQLGAGASAANPVPSLGITASFRRRCLPGSRHNALSISNLGRYAQSRADAALDYALHRLEAAAMSRALNGVARPVFYRGEQVGEYREYDERLTMFLLRYRRPERFGGWIDRMLAPGLAEADMEADAALRLDCIDLSAADEDGDDPPRAEQA